MGRPKRDTAPWFKHDNGMRNDPKVKALRRKFGLEGYAVYCMMIEKMTGTDGFFDVENPEFIELSAGDIEIDPALLQSIIDYCVVVKLLIREPRDDGQGNNLYSRRLKDDMQIVIDARNSDLKYIRRRKLTEENRREENREEEKEDTLSGTEKTAPDPVSALVDSQPPETVPYAKIIACLNQHAGSSFSPLSDATRRFIKARWNEGFRLPDFERVISTKCAQWKRDPKMVAYLRPQTLFGTKFEGYLNESSVLAGKIPCEECGMVGSHKYDCSHSRTAAEEREEATPEEKALLGAEDEPPRDDSWVDEQAEDADTF